MLIKFKFDLFFHSVILLSRLITQKVVIRQSIVPLFTRYTI